MNKLAFILSIIFLSSFNYSSAQVAFQKTFGGTGDDWGNSVQQTTDGGFIIAGYTTSFGAGSDDVYLIKTDVNGDTVWTKTFGGPGNNTGTSVQQTTDGGYIVLGRTNNFPGTINDIYLIKTDVNGDSLWTKSLGGNNVEYGNCVQQTTDGGYIISGWTTSFGAALYDVYVIKTDGNGNTMWSKTFGGYTPDMGNAVQQTSDGGYIVAGYTRSFSGQVGFDIYLIKTDADGDSLWTKTYGGTGVEWCFSVQQTTDGGYIIAGETQSFGAGDWDVYLLRTDVDGNSLWAKTFGGANDDYGYFAQQTTDGGYIITGYTNSFGAGNNDVYLIRTDANGDSLWSKTYGGLNDDRGYTVQQAIDGGYIITGSTRSFGAGTNDVYLIKTDSLGNSGCNEGNPGTIVTTPVTIELNTETMITSPVTIVYNTPAIVGNGSIINTLCAAVGINEITTENTFLISPNPSDGNFIISFNEVIKKGNVEISNTIGEKVFTENIFNESEKAINLNLISSGIYFVKVFDSEKSYCRKLIIK